MRWPNKNIGSICLETFNGNPQNNPEKEFFYIDISSIDNVIKKIVTYQALLGKNAPSRARKLINAGDILVSTVRPNLNAVAIAPLELNGQIASTGFCVLRANPELVDNRYIFYRTRSMDFISYLSTRVTGANYPAVTDSVVKSAPIPLPPLPIQKKIAAILEKADAAREKCRQANQFTEQFLQSAFLEMFGDPANNLKGWELLKLSTLGTLKRGRSKHRPRNAAKLLGGPYPLIQTGDVANSFGYIKEYKQTYSSVGLKQSKLWPKGTLCITIAANIAETGILTFDACFPDSIVGFVPNHRTNTAFIQ